MSDKESCQRSIDAETLRNTRLTILRFIGVTAIVMILTVSGHVPIDYAIPTLLTVGLMATVEIVIRLTDTVYQTLRA